MAYVLYRLRCEFPKLSGDERLEIYNEVWTRLLERSRSGFWPDDLSAWLIGAVSKCASAEHRKRAGRRTEPSDPLEGELALVADRQMEEAVLGSLDAEGYEAIIAALSPTERLVAKLRFDWGLSAREICEVTGLGRRRCYKEIERATARLRRDGGRLRRGEPVRSGTRTEELDLGSGGLVLHLAPKREGGNAGSEIPLLPGVDRSQAGVFDVIAGAPPCRLARPGRRSLSGAPCSSLS